jgi:tetratricopeptide (TPR) repeat protein
MAATDPELADELVATIRDWVAKEVIPKASEYEHADEYPAPLVEDGVAYAAAGQFDQAAETAEAAIKIASSAGADEIAKQIQRRLDLYKQGLPYEAPVRRVE